MQTARAALITGCSTGIGRATALYLASRGWHVIATARNIESIRELQSQAQSQAIDILPLDVADEASRARDSGNARAGWSPRRVGEQCRHRRGWPA